MSKSTGVITASQAAERLGISVRRVQQLVKSGRLPAEKFGPVLMIQEKDLALVADRKPGRPRKEPGDKTVLKRPRATPTTKKGRTA